MPSLTHPTVHMPESRKFTPDILLRVSADSESAYVVAYGKWHENDNESGCLATRWVTIPTGKVFPQSRGYASWDVIPDSDTQLYLLHLLALGNQERAGNKQSISVDTQAVTNLLS